MASVLLYTPSDMCSSFLYKGFGYRGVYVELESCWIIMVGRESMNHEDSTHACALTIGQICISKNKDLPTRDYIFNTKHYHSFKTADCKSGYTSFRSLFRPLQITNPIYSIKTQAKKRGKKSGRTPAHPHNHQQVNASCQHTLTCTSHVARPSCQVKRVTLALLHFRFFPLFAPLVRISRERKEEKKDA
ncbi:unnamed protein product [Periconia digitata]|uniref:Uncharacterized protein n=1 Tax=Periconia digitata TaxID=1303443 RepID=A0A9W4U733_9PLEO|nr:unnamed protein product [Periconia digitata]